MGANGCCPCWRAGTISRSAASAEQRGPIVSSREVIPIQTSLARQILARYTCDSQEIRLGGDIDMPQSAATRWVLLIHQIPPKPDYFRVKVGRRLQRLGAVAIKNSVYVLPRSDETVVDFQWQSREIVAGGGQASVCEANFVDGLTDTEIEALFRTARDADYGEIVADAQRLLKTLSSRGRRGPTDGRGPIEAELGRLKRRLAGLVAIDFFGAPRRRAAQEEVARLEARLRPPSTQVPAPARPAAAPRGATRVTRQAV